MGSGRARQFIVPSDCLDVFSRLPENTFDAIITDPPYGTAHKDIKVLKGRKPICMDFGKWDYFSDDDFTRFSAAWLEEAARVLKPLGNLVIFTKLERLETVRRLYELVGFKHHSTILWHKTNPPPKVRKTGFLSACEGLLWSTNGFNRERVSYTFNFLSQKEMHNFIETPICMGRERLKHPTQKPLKVFEWLLKIFTNEHDLVLDCFAGTGSLAEAAKKLNRSSFSIESDKTYFQLMVDRLSGEKNDESDTLHIFSFPEDILKFMDFTSDS